MLRYVVILAPLAKSLQHYVLTNKPAKEINEQTHSRNTGTGWDSNLELTDKRPIPLPLS